MHSAINQQSAINNLQSSILRQSKIQRFRFAVIEREGSRSCLDVVEEFGIRGFARLDVLDLDGIILAGRKTGYFEATFLVRARRALVARRRPSFLIAREDDERVVLHHLAA